MRQAMTAAKNRLTAQSLIEMLQLSQRTRVRYSRIRCCQQPHLQIREVRQRQQARSAVAAQHSRRRRTEERQVPQRSGSVECGWHPSCVVAHKVQPRELVPPAAHRQQQTLGPSSTDCLPDVQLLQSEAGGLLHCRCDVTLDCSSEATQGHILSCTFCSACHMPCASGCHNEP